MTSNYSHHCSRNKTVMVRCGRGQFSNFNLKGIDNPSCGQGLILLKCFSLILVTSVIYTFPNVPN